MKKDIAEIATEIALGMFLVGIALLTVVFFGGLAVLFGTGVYEMITSEEESGSNFVIVGRERIPIPKGSEYEVIQECEITKEQ